MKYGDAFSALECQELDNEIHAPTPRQIVGDAAARAIEAKARADADALTFAFKPRDESQSWMGQWLSSMEGVIYATQYRSRLLRNERKADAALLQKTPDQMANLKALRDKK